MRLLNAPRIKHPISVSRRIRILEILQKELQSYVIHLLKGSSPRPAAEGMARLDGEQRLEKPREQAGQTRSDQWDLMAAGPRAGRALAKTSPAD